MEGPGNIESKSDFAFPKVICGLSNESFLERGPGIRKVELKNMPPRFYIKADTNRIVGLNRHKLIEAVVVFHCQCDTRGDFISQASTQIKYVMTRTGTSCWGAKPCRRATST